ncbi:MAG: Arm DNA-binding domain-containing protein [Bacteroidia bacterium]|nr:Arm DNA-binding domain-containing protein [Bacteroidia bacterium]
MTDRNRTTFIFFIKRNKLLKNGEAPIYARIRVDKHNDELSVLRSIKPELWSVEKAGKQRKLIVILNQSGTSCMTTWQSFRTPEGK